jgi:cytosine permease
MTVGYGLGAAVGIAILGYAVYTVYALVGSSLGSRTGQTHALLTRSIFGSGGSVLVSLFVLIAPLAWVGFRSPGSGTASTAGATWSC